MGSKISEVPKKDFNTSVVSDSVEIIEQLNTDNVLPVEAQVKSVIEQDFDENYDTDGIETVINFIDDVFVEEPYIKKSLSSKIKTIILSVSLLAVILGIVTAVSLINSTAVSEEFSVIVQPTEEVTEKIVLATNQSLKFKKDVYSVVVGKTVKLECTYTAPDDKEEYDNPEIIYTSGNIEIATVDKNGKVTGVGTGTTNIVALSSTGVYTTVPVTVNVPKKHIIKNVPIIMQGDNYPSGCESVSSTMLLNYYGFEIDTNRFIDKYLPQESFSFDKNGDMYGPDAYSAFIGSPYSEDSLGCFPPVIENAMNDYFGDKGFRAVDVTGSSMESLITRYIANDEPVLIWTTMWMAEPVVTYEWKVDGAAENSPYEDGDTFEWLANEHCMLLVGYDEDYYYLNDPLVGENTKYERDIFEERYTQMGKCALVIDKIK
ncbi:MAG: C39 family peptidase [Acutalibacteraceae bacterium]|nr:C39 family peptidase [Acutalibacteraceae bacterium]